jgi:hypothetical protein
MFAPTDVPESINWPIITRVARSRLLTARPSATILPELTASAARTRPTALVEVVGHGSGTSPSALTLFAPAATIRGTVSRRNRPFLPVLLFLLLVSPAMVQLAFGYLDPGTGSYLLQLLIGGLLGGLFAIGLFWKRVLAFVKRIFKPRNNDAGNSH